MLDKAGRPAGTFTSTGVVIRSSVTGRAAVVEQHVFVLDDGTIAGAGQRSGEAGVFAVTGGTGRYAGARGSYRATVDPAGIGGSGAAAFDFVLSS